MKNAFLLMIIVFINVNCQSDKSTSDNNLMVETTSDTSTFEIIEKEETIDNRSVTTTDETNFDLHAHLRSYQLLKSKITRKQQQISRREDLNEDEKLTLAQDYFSNILIDSVFQYWIGTKWDFDGYTARPRDGVVACGYFVSTTLKHAGIELNRYKVAQKAAADIVKELCDTNSIRSCYSISELENYMTTVNDNELFIVGLDFHVGFIFRRNGKNYFAHSNYINRAGVMIEEFEQSEALKNSQLYYTGNVSGNRELLASWLKLTL